MGTTNLSYFLNDFLGCIEAYTDAKPIKINGELFQYYIEREYGKIAIIVLPTEVVTDTGFDDTCKSNTAFKKNLSHPISFTQEKLKAAKHTFVGSYIISEIGLKYAYDYFIDILMSDKSKKDMQTEYAAMHNAMSAHEIRHEMQYFEQVKQKSISHLKKQPNYTDLQDNWKVRQADYEDLYKEQEEVAKLIKLEEDAFVIEKLAYSLAKGEFTPEVQERIRNLIRT